MNRCLQRLNVNNLEQLREKRRAWVEASRDNDFEGGIKQLLTDLYPDNAHFIYELLQNAEDPRATVVRFTLSDSTVEFEHDGEKLFSLEDICSITSIGASTKRDDPTSIGKFGVGFKAVFAYNNTPEIHSGDFHFRIHDLVVPETEGVPRPRMGERETRFVFLFDNPKKTREQAVEEVQRGLRALGDNTLLFLRHIGKIEYLLPDGSLGTLERIEHIDGRIEIRASKPGGEETVSHWLRFEKDVEVTDEDGKLKICRIAIAYSLAEEDRKKKQSKWKIIPLDRGQTSIYFPASEEKPNLRFHIHAPFASTVARDVVRKEVNANRALLDHIAKLVVESLATIRDKGMLDVGFLAVPPNPADNLPEFYEPIREAVVEAFCEQNLTPTRSGEHRSAGALYRGPAKIAEVLGDEGLSNLTKYSVPLWVANAPQENQREDRFIQSLRIEEWGWSELASIFKPPHLYAWQDNEKAENAAHKEHIETFIQQMDDSNLMRFYALLGEAVDAHGESVDIDDLRIVRVTNDNGNNHVIPKEAYFQPEGETAPPSDVILVKPEVYSAGRSDPQKKHSKSFLETVGVRVYDEQAGIKRLLELYSNDSSIAQEAHQKHIRQFIVFWKKYPDKSGKFMFGANKFLQGVTENGVLAWFAPSQLCLDKPYLDTGLAKLTGIHKKYTLADGYEAFLKGAQLDDFVAFLKNIGVMHLLRINRQTTWKRGRWEKLHHDYRNGTRQGNTTDVDYTIDDMEKYLSAKSIPASRLLWDALLKAPENCALAQYSPNSKFDPRTDDSWLVIQLRKHAWIPDKSGEFRLPQGVTQDDLRTDFPFDNRNGLLTAIGFGENAKNQSEEHRVKNQEAQKLGLGSAEVLEKWKKVWGSGVTPDEILAQQAHYQRISQPVDSVDDPARRQRKVLANIADAPSRESVRLERAIQKDISDVTAQAKAYLRTKCMNADEQLVCQCCHEEMPFKLRSGEHYFEAVQCISDKETRHFQNRLALCPTCAAMYQYARETDDAEIRRSIIEFEADDKAPAIEIPIRLAGRELTLRFVGTHWFDLKTVLSQ